MKKYFLAGLVFIISLTYSTVTVAQSKLKVILAGDSTVANYNAKVRPLAGWGEFLPFCFDSKVKVVNYATGGASTRTFRDWGKWDKVIKAASKGDYILIQFGHNDEKADKVKKYSDPDTTFQDNLKQYIKEARAVGAIPVLITPPVRLDYDKKTGKLKETHIQSLWHAPAGTRKTSTTYHDAMRKVAQETNTSLLDLNKISREKIEALPSYEIMKTYYRFVKPGHKNYPKGIKDITHFSVKGAALMAKCLAGEMRRTNLPMAKYLKKDSEITVDNLIKEFNEK
ncbi:MAG: rhamnogalacturonan acetylesterase [Victivallaceae bacterium]|nr:rhamnogalacturonan acetylesterase [Victivallaceae bacterium]